jgi:ABC-type Na+ efflux pump permease subunit
LIEKLEFLLHRDKLGLAFFDQPVRALRIKQKSNKPVLFCGIEWVTVMVFLIIGTLAGVLLGLRFKVLVLVPFILLLACAIVVTGDGLRVIALTILATAVLVQIGYVLGLVVRVRAGRYQRRRNIPRYRPFKPAGF